MSVRKVLATVALAGGLSGVGLIIADTSLVTGSTADAGVGMVCSSSVLCTPGGPVQPFQLQTTTTTTAPSNPAQVPANAATAVQNLTGVLKQLSGEETEIQGEISNVAAEVASDSSLAPAEAALQAEYNALVTEYSQDSQSLTIAQGCANNTGAPTAQCLSLYG